MKKAILLSLIILFVISLTALPVMANPTKNHPGHSYKLYTIDQTKHVRYQRSFDTCRFNPGCKMGRDFVARDRIKNRR